MPFGIQPIHVVMIVVVGLVVFGPSKLPDLGRGLGRALTEFRKGSQEMAESFREELHHGPHEATAADAAPAEPRLSGPVLASSADAAAGSAGSPIGVASRCVGCATENPAGSRFCNGCGAALSPVPNR